MLSFLQEHGRNLFYSQNGEEGVLIQCVRRFVDNGIWPNETTWRFGTNPHCVEIGAHNGRFCSNTALLIESGCSGLFVEAEWNLYEQCKANWKHDPAVRVQCCRVDSKNINAFVDERCDVLSTDTDGTDYEIFKGLKAKPKIVIVEIDSSIPPGDEGFNSDGAAGYRTMTQLGIAKGYFLLCHTGNLVFVDKQYRYLFPEIVGDGLSNANLYFKQDWLRQEAA